MLSFSLFLGIGIFFRASFRPISPFSNIPIIGISDNMKIVIRLLYLDLLKSVNTGFTLEVFVFKCVCKIANNTLKIKVLFFISFLLYRVRLSYMKYMLYILENLE